MGLREDLREGDEWNGVARQAFLNIGRLCSPNDSEPFLSLHKLEVGKLRISAQGCTMSETEGRAEEGDHRERFEVGIA